MNTESHLTLRSFILHMKKVAQMSNNLQRHKRRLSEAVKQIQDYAQCFKYIDLDKKGVIYPKVLQNYLIKYKYYFDPPAISRFYSKYAHQKPYLTYQDLLEALLPHQDYILVANTVSTPPHQPSKFLYSCHNERIKSIEYFTCFVIQLQIKSLTNDYNSMKNVTKNSQRIGATLWRLLDRQHNNELTFQKTLKSAQELGINLKEQQWMTFVYWYFNSYEKNVNRSNFMKILDIQQQRKRASSACKIQQFKIQQNIYKRAEQDRLRTIRIETAVKDKLGLIPFLNYQDYRNIVNEEHFPFQYLNQKKELKGKAGYSRPQNMIKYAIQKYP